MLRCVCTFLLLTQIAGAQDFQWKFEDEQSPAFKWALTDDGDHREKTVVDPLDCVFKFQIGRFLGSCVHIGEGFFLTCDHVIARAPDQPVRIDDVAADVKSINRSKNGDLAIVHCPSMAHLQFAPYSVRPVVAGTPLVFAGRYTKRSAGLANGMRYTRGVVQVDLAAGEPCTREGDSGGGAFDTDGNCVGVLFSYLEGRTGILISPLAISKDVLLDKEAAVAVTAEEKPTADHGYLFTATWCGPCQTVHAKILPGVKQKLKDKGWNLETQFQEIDTDQHPDLVTKFNIKKIPCWVFVDADGEEVSRFVGVSEPALP
jgi:thiol-disulfide isomerase/thioredoxin